MKTVRICLAFALAALWVTCGQVLAETIYNVDPYVLSSERDILGGTITTDGTVGAITASNILSWSVNLRAGPTQLTMTPSNSRVTVNGTLLAGGGLTVPDPTQISAINNLFFATPGFDDLVSWQSFRDFTTTSRRIQYTSSGSPASITPPGPGVIVSSSIPEPSTILLGTLGTGLFAFGWIRRRRRARQACQA